MWIFGGNDVATTTYIRLITRMEKVLFCSDGPPPTMVRQGLAPSHTFLPQTQPEVEPSPQKMAHHPPTPSATPSWRPMTTNDIPGVMRVADEIHRDLPEAEAVFGERLALFPEGCLVLADGDGTVTGYVISFPIRRGKPPALNALLGAIRKDADQYYLHDLAILPCSRGRGAAAQGVRRVLGAAGQYPTCSLVSVYDTVGFWARFGFNAVPVDAELEEKLRGYGAGATYLMRGNT